MYKNKIEATPEEKIVQIEAGDIIMIDNGFSNDNVYIVACYPRADGKSIAGLILTSLTSGYNYNIHPMDAEFDRAKQVHHVSLETFTEYLHGSTKWHVIKSVKLTKESD